MTSKQIGAELGIDVITVKARRGQVMRTMWALAEAGNMAAKLRRTH